MVEEKKKQFRLPPSARQVDRQLTIKYGALPSPCLLKESGLISIRCTVPDIRPVKKELLR